MNKNCYIQTESAYHLFELLELLKKHDPDAAVVCNKEDYIQLIEKGYQVSQSLHLYDEQDPPRENFERVINLSPLKPDTCAFNYISANKKQGFIPNQRWSDAQKYYVISQAGNGFLTFHLRDLLYWSYNEQRPSWQQETSVKKNIIIYSQPNTKIISPTNWQNVLKRIQQKMDDVLLCEVKDSQHLSAEQLKHSVYLGPASLRSLILASSGTKNIHLTQQFQGMNLQPHDDNHFVIKTHRPEINVEEFSNLIISLVANFIPDNIQGVDLYSTTSENLFGTFVKAHHSEDEVYPFYCAHVVLWCYLIGNFDVNLPLFSLSNSQAELLQTYSQILDRGIRFKEYGNRANVDLIQDLKGQVGPERLTSHIERIEQVETTLKESLKKFTFISPFIDFYQWKKGEIPNESLIHQAEDHLIISSEECTVLKALRELLEVTLKQSPTMIKSSNAQG